MTQANLADDSGWQSALRADVVDGLVEEMGPDQTYTMLRLFHLSLKNSCEQIASQLDSEDLSLLKATAHGLKGMCMCFGAIQSEKLARLLELDTVDIDKAKDVLARLVEEVDRVERFVASWSHTVSKPDQGLLGT